MGFPLGPLLRGLIERPGGLGVALAAPVLLAAFSVVLGLPAGMKGGPAAALAEEKRTGVIHSGGSTVGDAEESSVVWQEAPGTGSAAPPTQWREKAKPVGRRGPVHFTTCPNAFFGEMWQYSVGKLCVLSGDHLKEAIPTNEEAVCNSAVTTFRK